MKTLNLTDAFTVEERAIYSKPFLDDKYYKEWKNTRTLFNEQDLTEYCSNAHLLLDDFKKTLQPLIKVDSEIPFEKELVEIIEKFQFSNIHLHKLKLDVFFKPFVEYAMQRIDNGWNHQIKSTTKASEAMSEFLINDLFRQSGKVLALELYKYKKEKIKSGIRISQADTDVLSSFIKENFCNETRFKAFLRKYPTLSRIIITRVNFFVTNLSKLGEAIGTHRNDLCNFLHLKQENIVLTNIEIGVGDSHCKGNTVIILELNHKKIVYKPRDLRILQQFEKFCNWINKSSSTLLDIDFLPKGLFYKDYAFFEFVTRVPVKSKDECADYYERYGYLIVISYLLGLNDLHLENIIAKKDQPILVDGETMFQNSLITPQNAFGKYLMSLNRDSIKGSCLLPTKLPMGNNEAIELSGLEGRETLLKNKVLVPVNIENSNFHFEMRRQGYVKGGENIPITCNNKEVNVKKYRLAILDGYNKMTSFVSNNIKELKKQVKEFSNFRIRILTKSTERYETMLNYAAHPSYNVEMKYRERLMLNIAAYPYDDKRIVNSEVEDLLFGDVPYFSAVVGKTSITDSRGKNYDAYFKKSGLNLALDRINNFNYETIEKERGLLLASLSVGDRITDVRKKSRDLLDQEFNYVRQASSIADTIMNSAFEDENSVIISTININNAGNWDILPMDESLYCGISGVTVFFIQLGYEKNEARYKEFAKKLLKASINMSLDLEVQGAFKGFLSPLYPLLFHYSLYKTLDYEEVAYLKQLEKKIKQNIEKGELISDFINGLGGIIKLLHLQKRLFGFKYISQNVMNRLEKKFMNCIMHSGKFGVAHGNCGDAMCLYEIGQLDQASALMKKITPVKNDMGWCKGVSGMLLARNYMQLDNNYAQEKLNDLENAPRNDTLCHGKAGIIMIMHELFMQTGSTKWKEKANLLTNIMLGNYILNKDYSIRRFGKFSALGLFDGLSGIGLSLLCHKGLKTNPLLLEIERG